MSYNEEEALKQSKFNDGALEMVRNHEMQKILIHAKSNISSYNEEFQAFNFEVYKNFLDSLWQDNSGKYTGKEKNELFKMSEEITKFIQKHCPIEVMYNEFLNKQKHNLNLPIMNVLQKALVLFELRIREIRESHGLSSPTKDDDEDGL